MTDEEEHLHLSDEYEIKQAALSTIDTDNANWPTNFIRGYLLLIHLVLIAFVAIFWYQGRQENGGTIPDGASWCTQKFQRFKALDHLLKKDSSTHSKLYSISHQ